MTHVRIRSAEHVDLVDLLAQMRVWLDHRRSEPAMFRIVSQNPSVVFSVDFAAKDDADEFAEAFGGDVL